MKRPYNLKEVESIEITCLQDNYVEMTAQDSTEIVSRASLAKDGVIRNSIQAEHGFSAIVRTCSEGSWRTVLFDFGFSREGAANNAKLLGVPMGEVECLALSHGHSDHTGGIGALLEMTGKEGLDFVCHPGVFLTPRYLEPFPGFKMHFPHFSRESLEEKGLKVVESVEPLLFPGDQVLFLGEISRKTDFEKGFPIAYRDINGEKEWDPIEDDTALAINLKGKGLVVVSGCAHSGIVNTLLHAKEVTGIDRIHAVIGGFHLSGPLFEPIMERTAEELLKLEPDFVVPCHCTGRKAIMLMEQKMADRFILNMSGTKLTFSA